MKDLYIKTVQVTTDPIPAFEELIPELKERGKRKDAYVLEEVIEKLKAVTSDHQAQLQIILEGEQANDG